MKTRAAKILIVFQHSLLVLVLCSCASAGKKFRYENVSDLGLGRLKIADYPELFGKPAVVGRKTTTNGNFDVVRFRQAEANRGRELVLEFKEGVLNAFFYVSAFDEDRTNLDLTRADQIKVGTSTKEDVLNVLGKPQGKALCPTVLRDFKDSCGKGKEIWAWTAAETVRTSRRPLKASYVYVAFDDRGKVVDRETTEIEVRPP